MSYGDYIEQFTYLPFLKMADGRSRRPYKQPGLIPAPYAWPELLKLYYLPRRVLICAGDVFQGF